MDDLIKEEFIEESLQCCLLCSDVRNSLKSLAVHMKTKHFEGLKKLKKILVWISFLINFRLQGSERKLENLIM